MIVLNIVLIVVAALGAIVMVMFGALLTFFFLCGWAQHDRQNRF